MLDVTCRALEGLKAEYADALPQIGVDGAAVQAFAAERGISSCNGVVRLSRAREALRRAVWRFAALAQPATATTARAIWILTVDEWRGVDDGDIVEEATVDRNRRAARACADAAEANGTEAEQDAHDGADERRPCLLPCSRHAAPSFA
jgi:hypothetical protein